MRSLKVWVSALAVVAVGCGAAEVDSTAPEASQDHLNSERDHRAVVDKCAVETDFSKLSGCLASANDKAAPAIDEVLKAHGAATPMARGRIVAYRASSQKLCDLLTGRDEETGPRCHAGAERLIADLIDAYADLGVPNRLAPDGHSRMTVCYQPYNEAPKDSTSAQLSAETALKTCIEDDGMSLITSIPIKGLEATFVDVRERGSSLCTMLVAASDNGEGTMAPLVVAGCKVNEVVGRVVMSNKALAL